MTLEGIDLKDSYKAENIIRNHLTSMEHYESMSFYENSGVYSKIKEAVIST
jgi:hypothetical protein